MGRRAILYTRVSTEEQKEQGFSLQEQEGSLRKYCDSHNIKIIEHYEEDHSAKDFNRPVFNKLLADLSTKKIKVDYLICVRWDRFSRSLIDGLNMQVCLRKFGVEIKLLEGTVDDGTPESLILQAMQMVMPEAENRTRSFNTKRGMRQARRSGRWTGKNPKGYKWDRQGGKSIIVPDENAHFIMEAFQEMVKGVYSMEEVRRMMWEKGYKCSRNQFTKVLRNPVYIGMITIPAWKEEPEEKVLGLHVPIVDTEIYNTVQSILNGRTKKGMNHIQINDHFPIRGYILCPTCGKKLTGSCSKSRSGEKYCYYHCIYPCKTRFDAKMINNTFCDYIGSFNIPEEILNLYFEIMKEMFTKNNQERERQKTELQKMLLEVKTILETVQDEYFRRLIERHVFEEATERYSRKRDEIKQQISELELTDSAFMKYISYDFSLLKNLRGYYERAAVSVKQKIIGSIFPGKLIFEENAFRTNGMNEFLALLTNNFNELEEIEIGQTADSGNLSYRASPIVNISNHLIDSIKKLYDLHEFIDVGLINIDNARPSIKAY